MCSHTNIISLLEKLNAICPGFFEWKKILGTRKTKSPDPKDSTLDTQWQSREDVEGPRDSVNISSSSSSTSSSSSSSESDEEGAQQEMSQTSYSGSVEHPFKGKKRARKTTFMDEVTDRVIREQVEVVGKAVDSVQRKRIRTEKYESDKRLMLEKAKTFG